MSIDPESAGLAQYSPYSIMNNSPTVFNDIGGDKIIGLRSRLMAKRYEAQLKVRQANIIAAKNLSVTSSNNQNISGLTMMNQTLSSQMQYLEKIKNSKIAYKFKESNKYAGPGDGHAQESSNDIDASLRVDQKSNRRHGKVMLFLHPNEDFAPAMASLVTEAGQFDTGKISMYSSIYKYTSDYGELTDNNDILESVLAGASWRVGVLSNNNITNEMNGLNNSITSTLNEFIPTSDQNKHWQNKIIGSAVTPNRNGTPQGITNTGSLAADSGYLNYDKGSMSLKNNYYVVDGKMEKPSKIRTVSKNEIQLR